VIAPQYAVHFVIENQLLGQVCTQRGISFMIFEDQLDLSSPKAFDSSVFGHGHGKIRHYVISDFRCQFRTSP
jgi:hypothetical protein